MKIAVYYTLNINSSIYAPLMYMLSIHKKNQIVQLNNVQHEKTKTHCH